MKDSQEKATANKSLASNKTSVLHRLIVNLCRFVVALTFIFSGYVKAIDPLGTQYKIQDYLTALNLSGLLPDIITLATAVILAAIEFCLGVFLLLAMHRRITTRITFLFMVFMTIVSMWLWIANPISDCGCFGDAVHLTNGQTFLKNIILLTCSVILMLYPTKMVILVSKTNQWIAMHYSLLFIVISSIWSLYTLPRFDFRPYHIGANIPQGMEIPEGAPQPEFSTTFILEKDGVRKRFTLDDYPDSTWTFIDSETETISEGYVPPIHDFSITAMDSGDDITDQVINDPNYVFLLVAPHLEKASDSNFGEIDQLYEYALENHYAFYGLTASDENGVAQWREMTGAEYPFCNVDETTLKTMIRSNPGLMLLKEGTIIRKWSHNRLPDISELKQPLDQSPLGQMPTTTVAQKIVVVLLWFALPLLVLILADRLWAWTKWLKKRKRYYNIYKHHPLQKEDQ